MTGDQILVILRTVKGPVDMPLLTGCNRTDYLRVTKVELTRWAKRYNSLETYMSLEQDAHENWWMRRMWDDQ